MKTQLTENFYLEEFHCHDGTKIPTHLLPNVEKLTKNLQVLRDEINKPIKIRSGYRSKNYNNSVGGSPRSQHLEAKAADLAVIDISPKVLHSIIESLIKKGKLHDGGLGLYPTFIHYDIRHTPTRWKF